MLAEEIMFRHRSISEKLVLHRDFLKLIKKKSSLMLMGEAVNFACDVTFQAIFLFW